MDRRERTNDPIEAQRAALEGKQAEIWTALPGIVQKFDPKAVTVTAQPAIQGNMQDEAGNTSNVNLPLLVDVPVVFPCGGGFSLTYPIQAGDECLVVFASRCIDGWWQAGGISGTPENRMHDLSDGFAIIGPRSQARTLTPEVDTQNVQLRTDDGKACITLKPDYTIEGQNPTAKVTLTPTGEITAQAEAKIQLKAPVIDLQAAAISMGGLGGGAAAFSMKGNIQQDGSLFCTGDQIAAGISQFGHTHGGITPGGGNTGVPE